MTVLHIKVTIINLKVHKNHCNISFVCKQLPAWICAAVYKQRCDAAGASIRSRGCREHPPRSPCRCTRARPSQPHSRPPRPRGRPWRAPGRTAASSLTTMRRRTTCSRRPPSCSTMTISQRSRLSTACCSEMSLLHIARIWAGNCSSSVMTSDKPS